MEKLNYQDKKILPVKSDVVFKAVFGKNDSKDVLADFLTDMLDLKIESSDDITIVDSELSQTYDEDKLSRLDIRIKTAKNEHIDVEI